MPDVALFNAGVVSQAATASKRSPTTAAEWTG